MCHNLYRIPSLSLSNPTSRDSFEWNGTKITKFIGDETDVVIPDGVKVIGSGAFAGRKSLKSVVLPQSVTVIGSWAFSGCRSLTSIMIPESVAEIGTDAFDGCPNLIIHVSE